MNIPQQEIYKVLANLNGHAALYVKDLHSGESLTVNVFEPFVACSLIKVPLLIWALEAAELGELDLDERISFPKDSAVGGTGLIWRLEPGQSFSWRDLLYLMIVISDNCATNALIDRAGVNELNGAFQKMGLKQTKLCRKMLDMEAIRRGENNFTTAFDMGNLLVGLVYGSVASDNISRQVLDIMSQQTQTNKLPALLPAVPAYATMEEKKRILPGAVLVANKTGELRHVQHDMGVFTLSSGHQYVIVMLTSHLQNDSEGVQAIAQVSRSVFQAMESAEHTGELA